MTKQLQRQTKNINEHLSKTGKKIHLNLKIGICSTCVIVFLEGCSKNILKVPQDRTNYRDFKTDLYFAETSSRPCKAILKVVKIDIFSPKNLQDEREIDKKYFNKSFLKLKVNANRHKKFENRSIRTRNT